MSFMEEPLKRGHLKFFSLNSSPIIQFVRQALKTSSSIESFSQTHFVHPDRNITTEVPSVQASDQSQQTQSQQTQSQQTNRPISSNGENPKSQVDSSPNPNKGNRGGGSENPSQPEWAAGLIGRMLQTETIEVLLETTVTGVHQSLQVDRVLIYRFQTESQGTVLAEAMTEGYTPMLGELLPAIAFGSEKPTDYSKLPFVALHNPAEKSLTPYQAQLLKRFQVKASFSLPIWLEGQLWGLFVVQQCARLRQWESGEVALLRQIVTELRLKLQPLGFRREQQVFARVNDTIRRTFDIDAIFQSITREVRKFLNVERVAICKFRPDYAGDFVAESKVGEWSPMVGSAWEDTYVREQQGGRFRRHQPSVISDVNNSGLSDCYVRILENFEIKAYAIVPIFEGETLWGVLCAYQHSSPRHWTEQQVRFLSQISDQLGMAIQRAELFAEKVNAEKYKQELPGLISKMSNAAYIQSAFEATVQEVRQLLDVERVCIYRFRPDYFGDFVYESESGGFPSLVGSAWEDTYIQEHKGGRFRTQEPYVADDIYTAGLSDCHVAALEYFGVKAFIVVAIKQGERLWGLLSAFQHSGSRHWLETEINLLMEIGRQLGATLQQADYLTQLQEQASQMAKTAHVSQSVTEIIPKILQSQDLDSLIRVTNQSVRRLLKCDRVAIYRFNPDWSSTLVGGSGMKNRDDLTDSTLAPLWPQTDLQATQGGPYRNHERLVVNNIHVIGHSPDEIEWLEELDVSAYMLVPIFKANQLWGLLGVYTSQPRSWAEVEINALSQIAAQISAAMQQLDYLQLIQHTSAQLAKTAEQERMVARTMERIRQSFDLQKAFKTTVKEIRNFLKADRVAVFKFDSESGYNEGETIAEDVQPGYINALGTMVEDHCFGARHAESYRKGRIWAVADIYQANLPDCYIEILAQFQVRANLVVPLLKGENLWGLFCIHQCSGAREWQESEIEFASQIAAQLNVAIQQGEYVEQLQKQAEQKEQLQRQVIQLLVSVRPALEGDLTVRALVTDNEVGTIADAYNNTLGSLRQIVSQMLSASNQVAQTSQANEVAISNLTTQAQEQFQTLNQALERVQTLLASTQAVETNAQQVEAAVQQANQTVIVGDATIDRTVNEMQNIRETVAEADERLQRLSESFQKISRVLNLIRSFTNQTQLLALNASIEATRAGEYGRGFAVVANEVRSLARQSADAATDIEQLVQEIQAGMAEVSTAMETGIEQVTSGTEVVTDARQSLNAIVNATSQISQLISGITQATQEQTQQCQSLTHTMTNVAAIANKTSEDSVAVATSFKDLLTMAADLQSKSKQFKVS
jgi:methyl-accepting chemotaxis protein PixJ